MDDIIDDYFSADNISHRIKFIKLYKYIIEVDIIIKINNDDNYIDDDTNTLNTPKIFVKTIVDFVNNIEVDEINYNNTIITKNKLLTNTNTEDNKYVMQDTYKEAFDYNFMINKDWTLFPFGYSGTYTSYVYKNDNNYQVNKYIDEKYYHINGQKEGLYKKYNKNEVIREFNYVNGLLNGYCYYFDVIFLKQKYFGYGLNIFQKRSNNENRNTLKLKYVMGKLHGIQHLIQNNSITDEVYYYKNYNIPWIIFKILECIGFI